MPEMPNNRMQSDKLLRYAPQFAGDAKRYFLCARTFVEKKPSVERAKAVF